MKGRYRNIRLKKYEEEKDTWPPIKTKSYVTLALVHQKELQTRQETTATIYLRTKGDIHKIPQEIDVKKLTDIAQIFDPVSDRVPNSILIEGHAGIGKTTLVKEICIQWTESKLLTSDKLVFLLLLRDPNVQKISNEQELIEHFIKSRSKVEQLCSYLDENHGAGVTFIIDGFDELSTELRYQSFFRKLIEKKYLPNARIVVTSRPSASGCLHYIVDKRIEILGFEKSSKKQYMTEALQDESPSKLEKLQRHFQKYPNIDAICYIPLIMSIIVFLCMCQPDDLPPTATKMYASFILHTICHYLKIKGTIPQCETIERLEQFPPVIRTALKQLEKVAFDGLLADKIVFTVENLPDLCKDDPSCYGLLQSTECYSVEEIGYPTQSFNFLHLGIQEYFAAKYLTTLPGRDVYRFLIETSFMTEIDSKLFARDDEMLPMRDSDSVRFSNVWILYFGMTRGKCKILRQYLATYNPRVHHSQDRYRTTISHSHRSRISSWISSSVSSFMQFIGHSDGSHDQMIPAAANFDTMIPTASNFDTMIPTTPNFDSMIPTASNFDTISQNILMDPLKVVYLFQCFQEAQDDELCEVLSKSFDGGDIDIQHYRFQSHQVVALGFFLSKSCRKWRTLNLSRCGIGDHGMSILHQYLCVDKASKQEITYINLVDNNLTGASSRLIGDIISHIQLHTLVLSCNNITNMRDISAAINNSTIRVLWISKNGNIISQDAIAISEMMICLEELDISYNTLGDHGAELLSYGITNTKTLKVLNIDHIDIGPSGMITIANAVAKNTSLEVLHMDNAVGQDVATAIAKAITNNKKLERLHTGSSNQFDKESAMIIIKSLNNNKIITELHLSIRICKDDISFVIDKAEMVNFTRSHNEQPIHLYISFYDLQGKLCIHEFECFT